MQKTLENLISDSLCFPTVIFAQEKSLPSLPMTGLKLPGVKKEQPNQIVLIGIAIGNARFVPIGKFCNQIV